MAEEIATAASGINKIKPPIVFKFRVTGKGDVIIPPHVYRGPRRENPMGDVFESSVDLRKNFPNKFELMNDAELTEKERANINSIRRRQGEEPLPRELPKAQIPTTPVGVNVTDKFKTFIPREGSHLIFKSEGVYFVWSYWKGAPTILNVQGVNKGEIEKILLGDVPPQEPVVAASEQAVDPAVIEKPKKVAKVMT